MEQTTSFVVARQEDILSVVANAKDITNYDGELILRQDNRLAQESFSSETSYLEHRIILALLTVIERENNFEQWYKICVSALAVWSNSSVQAVYNSIEKIKQSLHSRCLCIMPENNMGDLMVIPWFVGLYTIKEDGWIFVKLNPSLSQWTNGLKENYMEEHLSACFDYKKHATMILHNCFCSYFNYSTSRMNSIQMDGYVKEIKITIPSLRFLVNGGLDSPGYTNTANFFLRAVDPALKEINEKGYFKICPPPETPFRRATKYVDKPFYRLNKTGKFISSCVIYVMAGDKNTRLATQRLIDAKKEREKTLLKEQKNAIKTSLKEKKASNKTDLMEELINSMSKEEVILALEKAKSERE